MSINVTTSQNVSLLYQPASVGDRLLAYILDMLFLVGYFLLLALIATQTSLGRLAPSWTPYVIFLPYLFYDLFFEQFYQGQSPGKMIMKIKVVRTDGTSPTFGDYLIRWLFRIIENVAVFSGLIPILTVLINGKGKRLGDVAANTSVIRLKQKVSLNDTILSHVRTDYQVTFKGVENLSDSDMSIIKDVVKAHKKFANPEAIEKLAIKVKEVTGAATDLSDAEFLDVIISDYTNFPFSE